MAGVGDADGATGQRALVRPPPLPEGARIRVVSPGFPALAVAQVRRERAELALRAMGFEVDYGRHAFAVLGHLAGSAEQRAEDLHEAFADPAVDAVLCSLGGTRSFDLLEHIDWSVLRSNPKPLIGHSGNVVLLMAVHRETGLVVFHGPSFVNQFGEYPQPFDETATWFLQAVRGRQRLRFRPVGPRTERLPGWWHDPDDRIERPRDVPGGWVWAKPGTCTGPLLGGHVLELTTLLDTPWETDFRGAVLFWDAMQVTTAAVGSFLDQLAEREILQRCAGMVVGHPTRLFSTPGEASLRAVVHRYLPLVDGPVLLDADCGHTDPVWTLPFGVPATLDSASDDFSCDSGTSS